jgi:hypothetical protein
MPGQACTPTWRLGTRWTARATLQARHLSAAAAASCQLRTAARSRRKAIRQHLRRNHLSSQPARGRCQRCHKPKPRCCASAWHGCVQYANESAGGVICSFTERLQMNNGHPTRGGPARSVNPAVTWILRRSAEPPRFESFVSFVLFADPLSLSQAKLSKLATAAFDNHVNQIIIVKLFRAAVAATALAPSCFSHQPGFVNRLICGNCKTNWTLA